MHNRRSMVKDGLLLAGLGLAAPIILGEIKATADDSVESVWPYYPMDPLAIAQRAYVGYVEGGCCFGAFSSIIGALAENHGKPYSLFPLRMMEYGAGGVAGYGSLCGTLNGAAAVMGLFHRGNVRNELITQLFSWYEITPLPRFVPETPKFSKGVLATSQAESVLCHVSLQKWSQASHLPLTSPEKRERCARLTADIARKTVELLNAKNGAEKTPLVSNSKTDQCLSCHAVNSSPKFVNAKMACTSCHSGTGINHPSAIIAHPS